MNFTWSVELVRIGAVPPYRLRVLRDELTTLLGRPVIIGGEGLDPAPAFDPARGQYLVTWLIEALIERPRVNGARTIGVTNVDLFQPVFTHVFGSAQLGGPAGIASSFRLRPEFESDMPDPYLTEQRLLKEVLHELGHTLGLVHCPASWCVMNPSRLPEQVDLKDAAYCPACARQAQILPIQSQPFSIEEGDRE